MSGPPLSCRGIPRRLPLRRRPGRASREIRVRHPESIRSRRPPRHRRSPKRDRRRSSRTLRAPHRSQSRQRFRRCTRSRRHHRRLLRRRSSAASRSVPVRPTPPASGCRRPRRRPRRSARRRYRRRRRWRRPGYWPRWCRRHRRPRPRPRLDLDVRFLIGGHSLDPRHIGPAPPSQALKSPPPP